MRVPPAMSEVLARQGMGVAPSKRKVANVSVDRYEQFVEPAPRGGRWDQLSRRSDQGGVPSDATSSR